MKTYVLTLSQNFPAKHPRKGEPTDFKEKIYNGGVLLSQALEYAMPANSKEPNVKRHTIRANYELWRKRFEQIERGEACLSIRQWMGKPYNSKQREIARLTKEDGIGLQRLESELYNDFLLKNIVIDGKKMCPPLINIVHTIAQNDGLTFADWMYWMYGMEGDKKYLQGTYAIVHFTNFRY